MPPRGTLRHLVTLETPGAPVPVDGSYTDTWTYLEPREVFASIDPATARDLERTVANTVQSTASHIIRMHYHPGVTTQTLITKGPRNADRTLPAGSREFRVTGVQNPEERNIELVIAAVEVVQ